MCPQLFAKFKSERVIYFWHSLGGVETILFRQSGWQSNNHKAIEQFGVAFNFLSPYIHHQKAYSSPRMVAQDKLGSPVLTKRENSKWFLKYGQICPGVFYSFDPQKGLS